MDGSRCSCGILPCICVGDVEGAVDLLDERHDGQVSSSGIAVAKKSKLCLLFAADATSQCVSCMMLPCICPANDEAAYVEAVLPLMSDEVVEDAEEETDEYGRVRLNALVATGQAKNDDVWIAKEIKPLLKLHQKEGVQFLHSHVAAKRGCILADYMGLGKTLQVITVIHSFIVDEIDSRKQRIDKLSGCTVTKPEPKDMDDQKQSHDERDPPATVLVLCPAICLSNWDSEFQKWLGIEARAHCPVILFDSFTTKGTTAGRMRLLQRWKRTGGVLLMGYEMFRGLLNPTTAPVSCIPESTTSIRVCSRMATATMEITNASARETAQVQRTAREFRRFLCDPGAGLVVMDEGHRMKDPSSLLCQSVAQIRSPRRLVLTGYPVQNSLSEYWCMVNFAREGFLGSYDEFRANYERPILGGSTTHSQELIELLHNVVLRRGKALLSSQLPPKKEYILFCKLSPVQHQLYCDFLEFYSDSDGAAADLLTAYAALLQVMNHPDIIYSKLCPSKGDGSALLLGSDDEYSNALPDESSGWAWESEERLQEKQQNIAAQRRRKRQKLTDTQNASIWARSVIFGKNDRGVGKPMQNVTDRYETRVLENSGKMVVLFRIVEESFVCGDKVVVFSQSVPTLKVISDFLRVSSFSPAGVTDDCTKLHKHSNKSNSKRRRIAPRPNRDPAGILRKRRNQAAIGGPHTRKATNRPAVVSSADSKEWFLQIDGSTNSAKRMEYIQV
uniref:Helicase ATP-binding domain-containing protein n=1 Tax=Hyaloperonospora arabidopsidis (strain Emoy2) TaxID=559515 RepID=M4BAT8_HYAAE